MSDIRVRFAPSPTGHVHIGNIRAAIFNWLFARNQGGKFLLRVEDTDKERSTQAAIDSLLECMDWLGLDFDEEAFYQSSQAEHHIATANKLIDEGHAYRAKKGDGGEVTLFRMPWINEDVPFLKKLGNAEQALHPEQSVTIDYTGMTFFLVSKKGKAVPQENICLAGFRDLQIFDADGKVIFEIEKEIDGILSGEKSFTFDNAAKMTFTRHAVTFNDMIKGELAKPLDSVKDLVIVKSDGSPLFHLANVLDDITQNMSHIVRGDDHVENTYRHIMLYHALGAKPPVYAHLPMIVNKQGKPYSKRDGDAYVGDFRTNGYTAETLFNYLILLGWSPGDNEKVSREDAIKLFDLTRCKSTAAQMDMDKLYNLNGQYIEEMDQEVFNSQAKEQLYSQDWFKAEDTYFAKVAALMKSRTKLITQVDTWKYFFVDIPEQTDEKKATKAFGTEGIANTLNAIADAFAALTEFTAETAEQAIKDTAEKLELKAGKLNLPVRLATTGVGGGAELFPTLELLGQDSVVARLRYAAENLCQ